MPSYSIASGLGQVGIRGRPAMAAYAAERKLAEPLTYGALGWYSRQRLAGSPSASASN